MNLNFKDDALLLHFAGKPPELTTLTREGRVRLIGLFAEAMLAGRKPTDEQVLFVCGCLSAWLQGGGNLEKNYFRIVRPKSHATPNKIWLSWKSRHQDERQN